MKTTDFPGLKSESCYRQVNFLVSRSLPSWVRDQASLDSRAAAPGPQSDLDEDADKNQKRAGHDA